MNIDSVVPLSVPLRSLSQKERRKLSRQLTPSLPDDEILLRRKIERGAFIHTTCLGCHKAVVLKSYEEACPLCHQIIGYKKGVVY